MIPMLFSLFQEQENFEFEVTFSFLLSLVCTIIHDTYTTITNVFYSVLLLLSFTTLPRSSKNMFHQPYGNEVYRKLFSRIHLLPHTPYRRLPFLWSVSLAVHVFGTPPLYKPPNFLWFHYSHRPLLTYLLSHHPLLQ